VYRAAGWEAAGVLAEADVATLELAGRAVAADEVVLRPAGAQDATTVHALYTAAVRDAVGPLARTGPLSDRARPPKPGAVVLAEVDGAPVGYVRWTAWGDRLDVHDLVADRPVATAALLRAVASWHTTQPRTHLRLAGPALATVGTPTAVLARYEPWMLRVVDATAAVAGRGFPPVDVAVALDLDDPLVPDNAGRWLLTVADGTGRLERGGDGAVRLSVRGLAALFTGHLSARELKMAGLLDGPAAHLARLDVAFAGPAPWMLDSF
jgi:predicted acetyltransferase